MTGEKSVERAARKLAQWVRVPVVKLGHDGCIVVQDEKALRMKSIHVHVVDATGAGEFEPDESRADLVWRALRRDELIIQPRLPCADHLYFRAAENGLVRMLHTWQYAKLWS